MTLQGAGAVVAGFVVMALVVMAGSAAAALAMGNRGKQPDGSQQQPGAGYLAFDFCLGMAAALAGGLTTGWLAPFGARMHGIALAALVLAMAVACLLGYGDDGPPRWYQALLSMASAAVVVLVAPLATGPV